MKGHTIPTPGLPRQRGVPPLQSRGEACIYRIISKKYLQGKISKHLLTNLKLKLKTMLTIIIMSNMIGTLKEKLEVLIWTLALDAMYTIPCFI